MSILDTTEYFKNIYTEKYTPFEHNNYPDYNKNNWDNFCTKCHWNYNSNYHKRHCVNSLSLNNDVIILFSILLLFSLYKFIKLKTK